MARLMRLEISCGEIGDFVVFSGLDVVWNGCAVDLLVLLFEYE